MQRDTVTLAVDQIARIDFTMEVGRTQEIVNVQSTAVILETENSTVGNVVENRKITEIPLNGRNPLDLLALSTGIRIQGGFGGKNGSLGNFSANGGLANANSVMVEGLALDLAQMNSPFFRAACRFDTGVPRSDKQLLGRVWPNCRSRSQHEHQVRHE